MGSDNAIDAHYYGGLGGFIASLIDVDQGQSLFVDVGSWGALATLSAISSACSSSYGNSIPSARSNGYGGGGYGLVNSIFSYGWKVTGGTGGGASTIMTIPFNLSSRIIVAGGGGSAYIYIYIYIYH
jgi:Glycine rich protein